MTTASPRFENLEPLTTYLDVLQWVSEDPSEYGLRRLQETDQILTSKAVLYADYGFTADGDYCRTGYRPCTISGDITEIAQKVMATTVYARALTGGEQEERRTLNVNRLRNGSRVALVSLGGKLAVSGAFASRDIQPAYRAIRDTIHEIGGNDDAFTSVGLSRMRGHLLEEYRYIQHGHAEDNPISGRQAKQNIKSAWSVVGQPYGRLTGLLLAIAA